jgi:hypothetical protein
MPNDDWMNGFTDRNDISLVDISFPASHDAGLSEAPGGYTPYGPASSRNDTICHYADIAGQLSAGSRAFDLRIGTKAGEARTFHGEGVFGSIGGGWGQSAATIFTQVDTFLTNHVGEIVILRISHTKEDVGVANLVTGRINPNRLYKAGPRNIATQPLSALRGKAVAIFDEEALANVNPYAGTCRLLKYSPTAVQSGMMICGKYAGQTAGLTSMVKQAITCGNEHGTHKLTSQGKHDHLFMVYWQLAMDVKNKTTKGQDQRIKTLIKIVEDKGTHYNLDYLLNMHRGDQVQATKSTSTTLTAPNRKKFRPNWINLDWVNEISCNKVIEFNTELLPPRP